MTVQVEFWQLLTFLAALLLAFFGAAAAVAKLVLGQNEKRLDERFATLEASRAESQKHWNEQFAGIDHELQDHGERIARMEAAAEKSPTHDDLSGLRRRIDEVAGLINGLQGEFKGANHTLGLIHAFLLSGGK